MLFQLVLNSKQQNRNETKGFKTALKRVAISNRKLEPFKLPKLFWGFLTLLNIKATLGGSDAPTSLASTNDLNFWV
ncbi:hypothetical protein Y1Q_0012509 [Alligator mississippiensis]|uniref:Uncharacterized protein n=1 Tax=Alligator mississippiensis TaxID=8496 RepID=A0A151M7X4_ALLMI|nr:hypothetical protein Y1Q_0012509 [Alligator mississippiensis]